MELEVGNEPPRIVYIVGLLGAGMGGSLAIERLRRMGHTIEIISSEEAKELRGLKHDCLFLDDLCPKLYSGAEMTPKRSRGKGKKQKPWDNEWNTTSKYLKARGKLR
jgi:hypothetical protein